MAYALGKAPRYAWPIVWLGIAFAALIIFILCFTPVPIETILGDAR